MLALAIGAAPAAAVERIQDGGFEGSSCLPDDCTNMAWDEAEFASGSSGEPIGPICKNMTGSCERERAL
jgi:hypothetical protein